MSSMKITHTFHFRFPPQFWGSDDLNWFEVTLAPTSGQLNTNTGDIIDKKDIRDLVLDFVYEKLNPHESIHDIENLKFLPESMELVTQRLWEWIDAILPHSVKLVKLKVGDSAENFVEYTREEPVLVREPQPKPQTKLRKRRKKRGKGKRKDKDSDSSD